ncbi:multidrug resistance efflux transporter family protein [Leeuwenhoekiella marinoflava]|uniref:multidrug resistance efflux transporter family protein n=1 Tax=Leeuwenhoekiella marinoflava TaxID=988 RepID=UPI0030031237
MDFQQKSYIHPSSCVFFNNLTGHINCVNKPDVIAIVLFFMATYRVLKNEKALAFVEATQSAEVLFALIGEILI